MSTEAFSNTTSDELIARAVALADPENEEYWAVVAELHRRGDAATLRQAKALCVEESDEARVVGLNILSQLGYPAGKPYVDETFPLLISLSGSDQSVPVLLASLYALGHTYDARAIDPLLRHARHPDADVRLAVAQGLPNGSSDPAEPEAISGLIALTKDPDPRVRDWATFGLGSQLEADTPEIREALLARIHDEDEDTDGEALVGLARRKDARIMPRLIERLEDGNVGNLIIEAAEATADPRCLPSLYSLRDEGWDEDDPRGNLLHAAIAACERSQEFA